MQSKWLLTAASFPSNPRPVRLFLLPTTILLCASILGCGNAQPTPRALPPSDSATTAITAPAKRAPKQPADPCAAAAGPIEEVTRAENATEFTTDGEYLYWSDGHNIVRAAMNGSQRTTLVDDAATKQSRIHELLVSNNEVWFRAAKSYDQGCAGRLGFVPRNGGPVTSFTPEGCIVSFALTSDRVVFMRQESIPYESGIMGGVYSAPRKGGPYKTILRKISGTAAVAIDDQFIYFSSVYDTIQRIPVDGGTVEVAVKGVVPGAKGFTQIDSQRFILDGDTFFALYGHPNMGGESIARFSKDGSNGQILGFAVPEHPSGDGLPWGPLVTDEHFVYWTSRRVGDVFRVHKEGACPVENLGSKREGPDWVKVAGSYVYWLELNAKPPRIARRRLVEEGD